MSGEYQFIHDEAIFSHPDIEGVVPGGGNVDGGYGVILRGLGPSPGLVKAINAITGWDGLSIEADVDRIIPRGPGQTSDPDIVDPGMGKVYLEVHSWTVRGVARVMVGCIVWGGVHGTITGMVGGGHEIPAMTTLSGIPVVMFHLD